jgi:hypothetical protein
MVTPLLLSAGGGARPEAGRTVINKAEAFRLGKAGLLKRKVSIPGKRPSNNPADADYNVGDLPTRA